MMQTKAEARSGLPEARVLAFLAISAALVRVFALVQPQRIVWGDEPFYLWLGRNWLTGRGYSFTGYSDVHHTPMYPLLSGVFYLLTHNLELASDICYVLFGALLVVPVYLLAKEMYRREVGYASAAVVAIYPAIATAPAFWGTLTEPPYYLFVYTGLLMVLLAMRRERAMLHFSAGLLLGAAYLTRPEAIAYVAAAGGVLVLVRLLERRLLKRATLIGLALFLVGFLLFFLPYAYYVYRETGSWMVSEKAGVTFVTCLGLSEGDTRAFDEATWGLDTTGREVFFFSRESYDVSMIDVIREYPSEFVQLLIRNIRRFVGSLLSTRLFSIYLLPLMGLAFFKAAWDKVRAKGELLLLASLTPVAVFLLFFIQDRYIATLLPTAAVWLGLGVYELGVWLQGTAENLVGDRFSKSTRLRKSVVAIPTVLLVLFFVLLQPRIIRQYTNVGSFRPEHKTIGLWLKDHIPTGSVVMSRYPAIAFYADAQWEPTPNAEYEQIRVYAQAQNVDYLVLDEGETVELRPQLAFLLDPNRLPADLDVLHVHDSAGGRLVVFRLR
jgi:4-amino-4-deoxy-L-arabinose transferase-like glycosyltransferase